MADAGRRGVGRTMWALGLAGVLPQAAAVGGIALSFRGEGIGAAAGAAVFAAILYPALILSFLGGIWWGLALARGEQRPSLVALAVMPSLTAFALVSYGALAGRFDLTLLGLGIAIGVTPVVDARLERLGEAPAGWTRLRLVLSGALGVLTIGAAILVGSPR